MSDTRMIKTKFWDDDYISYLDPIEKLLFLYCLTNPLTNIAGIYEITTKRIAYDTGIDRDMVLKIFQRFETDNRMIYRNGWLHIRNFIKNQSLNDKVAKGIDLILKKIPQSVRDSLSIAYDSLSSATIYFNLNLNLNSNSNLNSKEKGLKDFCDFPEKVTSENAQLFEKFWELYPSRNGKKLLKRDAKGAFLKIKNGDVSLILQAVQNYRCSQTVRFIKKDYWREWLTPDEPPPTALSHNMQALQRAVSRFGKEDNLDETRGNTTHDASYRTIPGNQDI